MYEITASVMAMSVSVALLLAALSLWCWVGLQYRIHKESVRLYEQDNANKARIAEQLEAVSKKAVPISGDQLERMMREAAIRRTAPVQ